MLCPLNIIAMDQFSNIAAVIDLWPTRAALASDIGVTPDRVHKWAQKSAVPARFQSCLLDAGLARGFKLDADLIVRLHSVPAVRSLSAQTLAAQ
jgi:hypothetical protein